MHLFTATEFTGTLTDCDEGVLEWVPIERVPELPLWQGDHIFHRLLLEHIPFFSLKLVYDHGVLQNAILNGEPMSL